MSRPLADRARPLSIDDVCGQSHLLGKDKVLRRIIESGNIPNLIFYGPSGVGKTTVANIIADSCGKRLYHLNATTASISDIKDIIGDLGGIEAVGGVMLYLDEIQYFNKKQQQILLQYLESGDITLIASTTENPYFYVYNAILSRSTVFEFKQLSSEEILISVKRAIKIMESESGFSIKTSQDVLEQISRSASGDVRRALNALELCFITSCCNFDRNKTCEMAENIYNGSSKTVTTNLSAEIDKNSEASDLTSEDLTNTIDQPEVSDNDSVRKVVAITNETVEQILENNSVRYDLTGDEHFDVISAYQKSMRGSDADAALHYLARLLVAGDLQSACRRLLVCASEDVGLAYPQIIPIVKAAVDSALQLGLPEARIPLANAVILVANSPKSNSSLTAIDLALKDVENGMCGNIPRQLQNKHFDGAESKIKGQRYLYPHSYPNHYVKQQYLPDKLKNHKYYEHGDNPTEKKFSDYLSKIKNR